MKAPNWLLPDIVISVHSMLVAEHGGVLGVRDKTLLESALARLQQNFSYLENSSVFELAASYSYGIVKNHPFVDGNKRIAFTAGAIFLELNGYELNALETETVVVFEQLAAGHLTEAELAKWYSDLSDLLA